MLDFQHGHKCTAFFVLDNRLVASIIAAMPYQFFFSYSSEDRHDDLKRFVADLCADIRSRKHVEKNEVAFYDGDSIQTGAPWKEELATGLRTSRVFLAVCSPNYINSEFCGKEFKVFLERYDAYRADAQPAKLPRLILPVLWGVPNASLKDVISEFQYEDDAYPSVYVEHGLRYLMSLKGLEDDYKKFVARLAQKIVDGVAEHSMPDLQQLRPFEQIPSAFHDTDAPEGKAGDRAWFVFVAPKPTELKASKAPIDRYDESGGEKWRPFGLKSKSVGIIAQLAAAQYERFFKVFPAQGDLIAGDLLKHLDKAESTHDPVVILVDPWSLKLPSYEQKMKQVDKYIRDTSAILVPWNSPDPETDTRRQELKALVEKTFVYRVKGGKPFHYWGEVDNAADLSSRLLEILAHYTNKVLETTEAEKKIPEQDVLTDANDTGVSLGRPPMVDNGPAPAHG